LFSRRIEFSHVIAGNGWLIFAFPPAELAVHPAEEMPKATPLQYEH